MASRFSAKGTLAGVIALAAVLFVAACIPITPPAPKGDTPEEQLAIQSRALQRTVLEGAMLGAAAGTASDRVWGRATPVGLMFGVQLGTVTGTYLGFLQNRYATNEARLERLKSDIDLTNAATEATIRTMRVVLDRQRRELSAANPQASAANAPESPEPAEDAQMNLTNMQLAISGVEGRRTEFENTRSLHLVEGESTGVDSQIADLSSRIIQMREIAGTLAAEL